MKTMPASQRIMIVAGEASGDLHGARLVREMRARSADLSFWAIGGRALKEAGATVLVDADTLSVVGITEVVSRLPQLLRAMRTARRALRQLLPDLLVLIDFPDFNLHLAATAKKLGVPVLYYICPQVWAWRKGRVRTIRRRVDHAAVILPFEADFFRRHGVDATYVGHPLLDKAPDLQPAPEADPPVVGLLPGSRHREVARHLPTMVDAARRIERSGGNARFWVSIAPSVGRAAVESVLAGGPAPPASLSLTEAPVEDLFSRLTMAVAVSGTVTLQAALAGTPTVIIYRVSGLSYVTGRLLVRVPYIGLANLIAGRRVMPELIQKEADAARIAETVSAMLGRPSRLKKMRSELLKVRDRMGRPGAAGRVADIALHLAAGRTPPLRSAN
jgi:lipid-A-disaccharide synthase